MIRKNEQLHQLQELKTEFENLKEKKQHLQERKAKILEEDIWEDTLEGKVAEEESKTRQKLCEAVKALSMKTGKKYNLSFNEFHKSKETTSCPPTFQELTSSEHPRQRELLESVVGYCADHKWNSTSSMKSWMKKVIDDC